MRAQMFNATAPPWARSMKSGACAAGIPDRSPGVQAEAGKPGDVFLYNKLHITGAVQPPTETLNSFDMHGAAHGCNRLLYLASISIKSLVDAGASHLW